MGQPLADCDFNRAALHPAYPIKRRTSAQRTQASPERRHPEESPALDPLENSIRALPPSTAGARLGWNRAAVPAITNVDGQGTHRRLGNSPRGVASRAASKASLSAVSDNANLIAGALAMRAINT
jgi:hypothetical protein